MKRNIFGVVILIGWVIIGTISLHCYLFEHPIIFKYLYAVHFIYNLIIMPCCGLYIGSKIKK